RPVDAHQMALHADLAGGGVEAVGAEQLRLPRLPPRPRREEGREDLGLGRAQLRPIDDGHGPTVAADTPRRRGGTFASWPSSVHILVHMPTPSAVPDDFRPLPLPRIALWLIVVALAIVL